MRQYYETFIFETPISFQAAIILIYDAAPRQWNVPWLAWKMCVCVCRNSREGRALKNFSHKSVKYKDFEPENDNFGE